jgi:hypothetical protein
VEMLRPVRNIQGGSPKQIDAVSPNLDVDYRKDFEGEKLCCYFFGSLPWRSRLRVVFNHMKKKRINDNG